MYSEWKKSDTLLKAPVIWTLTLDVFTKLLLSAEVCLMMSPTFLGVLHEQVMFCSPHLLPGLKSPFLSLFPDQLFQFLSYSLNFISFFFLPFQENNLLVCVPLAWPLWDHYCLQAGAKIYISASLILVTEGFRQVSKLPQEHLCSQWCTQRRAFSQCTETLCWAEAHLLNNS